jgi:hypothetical protein
LLEEWAGLIDTIVYFKDEKEEPAKAIKNISSSSNTINSGIEKT